MEKGMKRLRSDGHIEMEAASGKVGAVFVTGANGYIGTAVACAFRSKGHKVFGLVREKKQAHDLVKHEVIPVVGDLNNPSSYEYFVRKAAIIVNNAVDWDNPNKWISTWERLYETTVLASRELGPKMFIETSAPGILIYGNQPGKVLDESATTSPDHGRWKALEDMLIKSEDVIGVVIRAGFAYGKAGGLTHNLFKVAKKKQIIIEHGKEDVKWSWVHIDDLSDAYVKIAHGWSAVGGQVFNIAGDEAPTWKQLRVRTAQIAGFRGPIFVGEVAEHDLWEEFLRFSVVVSSNKAKERVGWVPHHKGFVQEIDTYFYTWREHYKDIL